MQVTLRPVILRNVMLEELEHQMAIERSGKTITKSSKPSQKCSALTLWRVAGTPRVKRLTRR